MTPCAHNRSQRPFRPTARPMHDHLPPFLPQPSRSALPNPLVTHRLRHHRPELARYVQRFPDSCTLCLAHPSFKTGRYCAVTESGPSGTDPRFCFKPLQNGAVLCWNLCQRSPLRRGRVSNPFKTGRYCAEGFGPCAPWSPCFKPLQNGAVLCWESYHGTTHHRHHVSNPFKTGRYCAGRHRGPAHHHGPGFQTPSKRGGTVLPPTFLWPRWQERCFKPLQNGAVLCCARRILSGRLRPLTFQTPSKRGGTVLLAPVVLCGCSWVFQTPSKRGGTVLSGPLTLEIPAPKFQTPSKRGGTVLHVAARCSARHAKGFKPLQNGAVLCCGRPPKLVMPSDLPVSNPFKTGRYCAETFGWASPATRVLFQTPSKRGGTVL